LFAMVAAPTVLLGLLSTLWGPPVAAAALLVYACVVMAVVYCCKGR